ncbi:hypothetical protein JOD54_006388 [Actinokineospora baliensis]|uniref:hypothetical protein n=1 Tax=Actinokineospora baliensis TaxID=547056 RepID=UPI0019576971|nr:hypothetical protein [Actinokineospora baliensis]MBM7776184.1 hypothetical protein [Actinokineospora baliensis]
MKATCPSGQAAPGATLLGIMGPGGRVVFTPHGPSLTEDLRTHLESQVDGPLETRYRFATPCATTGCAFWDGACRALDAAHEEYPTAMAALPECGIRDTCRWWSQEGPTACAVCPQVRTRA